MLLLPSVLFGQSLEGGLATVRDWVVAIVNIIFVIAIVVGIIRTVVLFISGNAGAVRSLIYLVIAVLIWFIFSNLVGDFSVLGDIGTIG
jgi:hypothetical protein